MKWKILDNFLSRKYSKMVPEVLLGSFQGLKSGRLSVDHSKLSTSGTSWSTYELWWLKKLVPVLAKEGKVWRADKGIWKKKAFVCIVWSTELHLMAWRQYLVQSLRWISARTVLKPERNKSNWDGLLILSWKMWVWTGLTKDASTWEIPAEKSSGSSVRMFSYKHTDENISTDSKVNYSGFVQYRPGWEDNYSESNGRAPRMVWTLRCWLKQL